jgi:hypothetical protein
MSKYIAKQINKKKSKHLKFRTEGVCDIALAWGSSSYLSTDETNPKSTRNSGLV